MQPCGFCRYCGSCIYMKKGNRSRYLCCLFQTRCVLLMSPGRPSAVKERCPLCRQGYGNAGIQRYFPWCSSETVSFLRPCARREASTRRPFLVFMRSRKPCLFTRRRLCGWNVLFILLLFCCYFCFVVLNSQFGLQKYVIILK